MTPTKTLPGFSFAMLSSVGRVRSGNEDFCAAAPESGIFIVCDGMGGAAAGEVASKLAATTFIQHMEAALPLPEAIEPLLHAAVGAANTAVHQHAQTLMELKGMGTTLVALVAAQGAESERSADEASVPLWLAHVGDSRCYRMRDGELQQVSEDHSFVQEQIKAGQLTAEQAERSPMRNIITRAIGSHEKVQAAVEPLETQAGDVYLLASDGLSRELSDAQIGEWLAGASSSEELEGVCTDLIEAANEAGGHDNVTVLLLRVES